MDTNPSADNESAVEYNPRQGYIDIEFSPNTSYHLYIDLDSGGKHLTKLIEKISRFDPTGSEHD